MRKIFGTKMDEVTGSWRRRNNRNGMICTLHQSIIRIIKCSKVRWAGHVARMGEKKIAFRLLVEKTGRKDATRKTKT
jgi:hypothetical protein